MSNHNKSSRKPNLLFIMTDQHQGRALSIAGNKIINTPNIDRIGNEGAFFKNAYSSCPVCVPARTIILTGHSMQSTGILCNKYSCDDHLKGDEGIFKLKTFDEILIEKGYKADYYGKWHSPEKKAEKYQNRPICVAGHAKSKLGKGGLHGIYKEYLKENKINPEQFKGDLLDKGTGLPYKPDPLDYSNSSVNENDENSKETSEYGWLKIPKEYSRTAWVAKKAIKALKEIRNDPFTITVSIGPPHPPMILTKPYYGKYKAKEMPLPDNFYDPMTNSPYHTKWKSENMKHYQNSNTIGYMISNYYGLIDEVDYWVGEILKTLDELGLTENTLVIFTSDHGEMLGAHGMNSKCIFYEESVHIPLLIQFPGKIEPETKIDNPVSQIDIFPTILDYLDIYQYSSEGNSLRNLIEGNESEVKKYSFAISEWHSESTPNYMVRTKDWKLIFSKDKSNKSINALYHIAEDPNEETNLIGNDPNHFLFEDRAEYMKDILVYWLKKVKSPHLSGVRERPTIKEIYKKPGSKRISIKADENVKYNGIVYSMFTDTSASELVKRNRKYGWKSKYLPTRNYRHFWFAVRYDDFREGKTPNVKIIIEYFDEGDVEVIVRYDSSDKSVNPTKNPGVYKKLGEFQIGKDKKKIKWKKVKFTANDCYFTSRCNGYDIRLETKEDKEIIIRGITIKKLLFSPRKNKSNRTNQITG